MDSWDSNSKRPETNFTRQIVKVTGRRSEALVGGVKLGVVLWGVL